MPTQRANVLATKLTLVQIRDVNKFAPTPPLTTTSTPNLSSVVKGGQLHSCTDTDINPLPS